MLDERHRIESGNAAASAWEKTAESARSSDEIVGQLEALIFQGYESNKMAAQQAYAPDLAMAGRIDGSTRFQVGCTARDLPRARAAGDARAVGRT